MNRNRNICSRLLFTGSTLLGLTACGGESQTPSESIGSAASTTNDSSPGIYEAAPGFGGQATITFDGQTESFELANCVSGTASSIQGSGRNANYSLTIDVQEGGGSVTLSKLPAMIVYLDGDTEALSVSENGSFRATGSAVIDFAEHAFEVGGTCDMLNWR